MTDTQAAEVWHAATCKTHEVWCEEGAHLNGVLIIQCLDGRLGLVMCGHVDEAAALADARPPIHKCLDLEHLHTMLRFAVYSCIINMLRAESRHDKAVREGVHRMTKAVYGDASMARGNLRATVYMSCTTQYSRCWHMPDVRKGQHTPRHRYQISPSACPLLRLGVLEQRTAARLTRPLLTWELHPAAEMPFWSTNICEQQADVICTLSFQRH